MRQDARVWQVVVLGGVLLFGVSHLDFPLSLSLIGCSLATAILSEYLLRGVPGPEIMPMPRPIPGGGMQAFVTRLHVRYDAKHFPEDLSFKITQDSSNFQGRYIIHHPWTGATTCPAGQEYLKQLAKQQETRAQNLATLTGWDIQQIRTRMPAAAAAPEQSWSERIKALFNK